MFLCGSILPILMIILVLTVMVESPRWLVSKDRVDDAIIVLQQIYPPNVDTKSIIYEIQESIQRDKQAENGSVGWSIIRHPTPGFQRMLLIGISMAIAQQAIGIDAIQYYLLDVIDEAGYASVQRQSIVLILLGLIKLCFVIVGGRLFDYYGRRPLIILSLLGCASALLIISICFAIDSTLKSTIIILSLSIYLAFFSIGMGPGGWLIPSEVFAISIRGPAMSLATISNRLTATLMSSTFLSTANSIGWASFFFLLCVICILVTIFMYKLLPETRNKSLEEMSLYFAEIMNDTTIFDAEEVVRMNTNNNNSTGGGIQLPNRINDNNIDSSDNNGLT
jgi:predicted MFS family arabinose efflux permease